MESNDIENCNENNLSDLVQVLNNNESKKKKCCKTKCKFPTAYSIIIIIQVLVFVLTFIIPKGKYATILYENGQFVYTPPDPKADKKYYPATQETLDELGISIKIDNFLNGHIKKAIAVPNTYQKLTGANTNIFNLFLNPIMGMVESAEIAFFLMILGGNINVLLEMGSLTNGIEALAKLLKGRVFILLCIIMILVSIGGTTFGMQEEMLAFYPILMPIFLKNGLDGVLGVMSMLSGSAIGIMFSTVNPFAVVIGSYSAGISFSDGLWFRLVAFIIGDILTCSYLFFYYRKISKDQKKSVCYGIKKKIEAKFLKEEGKEKEEENDKKKEDNNINNHNENKVDNNCCDEIKGDNDDNSNAIKEKKELSDIDENSYLNEDEENNKGKSKKIFSVIQKLSLLLFASGFIIMRIGVVVFEWWFNQMTAVFFVIGIIIIFLSGLGEEKGIKVFNQGVGDFASISLIIGLARGVNLTLENGLISDTILYALSGSIGDLSKIPFAIVMIFIFLILGFFIQSSSGLAVLTMPIFAPLAEKVNCPRTLIVNAFMFSQSLAAFISPTGLLLIILELTGVPFNLWIKFIWPFIIIIFSYIIILIVVNSFL